MACGLSKKFFVHICRFREGSRRTEHWAQKMSVCLPHDAFSGLVGVCLAEKALKRTNEGQ